VLAAVDRGAEGGEVDLRGVDDRPWQSTNSWLLASTDPALAGACVLSAVFPRIECQTNENENDHLIR